MSTMSQSSDEPTCPRFQPNIFDPSRCHECLRQRHLHTSAGERTKLEPQQKPLPEDGNIIGQSPEFGNGIGSSKRVLLTPISSQAEERDTSSSSSKQDGLCCNFMIGPFCSLSSYQEDSDSLSVVSSYCDVNGGQVRNGETSLCILSPDCRLYICEDINSTDSYRYQSEEFSCSVSTDDEHLPIRRHPAKLSMTRLDPPPHRVNPRQAWMEETRDGTSFMRGIKNDREKRESGYYSLGRTAAAHFNEKSPPNPFRHFERGHPIFSHRNIEPKDTIPFRNPNLGVASERPIPEMLSEDFSVEIPPPDPYEVAVEVEAQVGPRSPSPTPFKIAESLASTGRKSLSRVNPLGNISYQQSGRYDPSRQGSALQSRSSSPSRENLQLRRRRCGSPIREGYGLEGQAQLRNLTTINGLNDQECEVPTMSSSRDDYDRPRQSILRKTESSTVSSSQGWGSRPSSPSRRGHETFAQGRDHNGNTLNHENHNSSSSRQNFDAPSQSHRHKTKFTSSVRSRDTNSSLALKGSYDASDYHPPPNMQTGSSFNSKNLHTSSNPSPSRKGNIEPPGYSILRSATKGDSNGSLESKHTKNETKYDSHSLSHSWRGSTHSLRSSSLSRSASPSRHTANNNRAAYVTLETSRTSSSMRSRAVGHSDDDHHPPAHDKSSHRAWSPSPSPHIHIQTLTSSQSSMESSESGRLSVGSTGQNKERYALIADLPKVKIIHQKEMSGHIGQPQSVQPVRRQELFKPARSGTHYTNKDETWTVFLQFFYGNACLPHHSLSRHPSIEWDDPGDTDRDGHYGGSGYLSRAHSTTSLQPFTSLMRVPLFHFSQIHHSGLRVFLNDLCGPAQEVAEGQRRRERRVTTH
ncbi:hypothetical protein GOODEAATRI_021187 [Goodea atripinnis]|uniref:Uncharacterized protein n=1 Tax=Goodea atripinnis TaxID=208336 RepID=A0ABV0NWH2_9TELE